MSRYVFSFDPGITTGYAAFRDSKLLETADIPASDIISGMFTTSLPLLDQKDTLEIVIEDTPVPTFSAMNRQLAMVISMLKITFPEATVIPPGVWKNSFWGRTVIPIVTEVIVSKHQEDAIRLGLHFISILKGIR
jgi:hypothetical protein